MKEYKSTSPTVLASNLRLYIFDCGLLQSSLYTCFFFLTNTDHRNQARRASTFLAKPSTDSSLTSAIGSSCGKNEQKTRRRYQIISKKGISNTIPAAVNAETWKEKEDQLRMLGKFKIMLLTFKSFFVPIPIHLEALMLALFNRLRLDTGV